MSRPERQESEKGSETGVVISQTIEGDSFLMGVARVVRIEAANSRIEAHLKTTSLAEPSRHVAASPAEESTIVGKFAGSE